MSVKMERLETPHLRVNLYDRGTTMREIALEEIKIKAEPEKKDPDDPFIIYDLGDIVDKDNQWRKLLPNVETFFAVKSNPDPVFIRLLLGLGRSFDCSSKIEIQLVLDLGGSPDRIIYAHPYKQESHLRFARENGVRLMTFDTKEELHKIKRVFPEAQLVLRISYDDVTGYYKFGSKFGCHHDEVHPLMQLAKELELDIVGISFHVGTESTNPQIFREAIRDIRPMFDAGTALGFNMKLLDIGGGFPGKLQPKVTFDKFADIIREALEENFPPSSGVRVIAEPGKFYTRSAGYLVANVIAKRVYNSIEKKVESGTDPTEPLIWMYYLNVGVYNGCLVSIFFSDFFELPEPLNQQEPNKSRVKKPSRIWGPTCDAYDLLFKTCMMPEMEEGEFVLFNDMGCYVSAFSCGFNGYPLPPSCFVAPKEIRPLLERIFST